MVKRKKYFNSKLLLNVSTSSSRSILHAIILLIGAGLLLAGVLWWEMSHAFPDTLDKALHFRGGQVLAVVIFYLAYICIVVRVLVVGRVNESMTRVLLWLPAMIVGALVLSIAGVFLVAVLKEFFDLGGGNVEWQDIDATIDGAMTIVPFVGIIMASTPLFIPLDMLLQLPKLMFNDVRTGISTLDSYVKISNWHNSGKNSPEVLVIEDDIDCATVAMNFCRNIGLTCFHVSTAIAGLKYLYDNDDDIRLVMLDNFLRVDNEGCNMTGADWLVKVNEVYPATNRHFHVIMISGHTEMLHDIASLADLVLQKPWSPARLIGFLKEKKIIKREETFYAG